MKIDLHLHTCISDGTDTPEEILAHARKAGMQLFSVTDHDAVRAGIKMRTLRKEGDPAFLCGAEFSCKDEEGKYHILGYGFDPEGKAIRRLVETGHSLRMKKVRARLDFLRTEFGFTFPKEEIEGLLSLDNPGKPHIGNMMVRYGYAATKDEAIRDFINRVHFRSEYLRPEQAIEGILDGGGIPVLAHPAYGSGDQLILGSELMERFRKLTAFGLQGAEAYYSGFTRRIREQVLSCAEELGLYVTAGSDYHGSNKLVVLGDTGLSDTAEGAEGLQRFLGEIRSRDGYFSE